jgi:hypothetical protein
MWKTREGASDRGRCSSRRLLSGFETPRQHFLDFVGWMTLRFPRRATTPRLRIDVIEFASSNN